MDYKLLGYSEEDKSRHERTLFKLLPYLTSKEFILCGGSVIRFYAISNGIEFPQRGTDDIDIIISKPTVLNKDAQKDFLVYHYHLYPTPTHEVYFDDKFYIVLVDEDTKLKVQLFDYNPYTPHQPVTMKFRGYDLLFRNVEDQLCTAILEGCRILNDMKQDPKKFFDIEVMLKLADIRVAEKYWASSSAKKPFHTLQETYQKMLEKRQSNPELVFEKAEKGSHKEPFKCEYCSNSNGFKVTPMEEVYKTLGYSE